jgi:thiol-disulfide isomerase/thioredoxin
MVLYYTATWCPPCRAIAPIFEKLSEKYENIVFTKIDVDQLPEAATAASIRSVPTFIFKNKGKTVTEVSFPLIRCLILLNSLAELMPLNLKVLSLLSISYRFTP